MADSKVTPKTSESPAGAWLRARMAGLKEYCDSPPVKPSAGETARTALPLGGNCPLEMFGAAIDFAAGKDGEHVQVSETGVRTLAYNAQSLAVLTAFDGAFKGFYPAG